MFCEYVTRGLAGCSVVGKARVGDENRAGWGLEVLAMAVPASGLLAGEAGVDTRDR